MTQAGKWLLVRAYPGPLGDCFDYHCYDWWSGFKWWWWIVTDNDGSPTDADNTGDADDADDVDDGDVIDNADVFDVVDDADDADARSAIGCNWRSLLPTPPSSPSL